MTDVNKLVRESVGKKIAKGATKGALTGAGVAGLGAHGFKQLAKHYLSQIPKAETA